MSRRLIVKLFTVSLLSICLALIPPGAGCVQGASEVRLDDDWVYHDMELLSREGLVKNYPIDWVQAGHKLSRMEFAYYLKQTVIQFEGQKTELKLSPKIIGVFEALILEFQKELSDMGIKATNINKVSPNPVYLNNKPDNYQDLDLILAPHNNGGNGKSYYYYGQYYSELQRKSFFFIPSEFITTYDSGKLEVNNGAVNILYQPELNSSFLVLKGSLPVANQSLKGYYLFPITDDVLGVSNMQTADNFQRNSTLLFLLDEISQMHQVDSVLRYNGSLNLEGFSKMKVDLPAQDNLKGGSESLTVGGLLIYSNNPATKTPNETKDLGLPVFNSRQTSWITPVDLDLISSKSLQSLQINIQGTVEIAPQTSLFGGIDLFYQGSNVNLLSLDNPWPSDTKASAGVSFRYNDYWTFITYQSLVNTQKKEGWFSTTSVGVEYNNWVSLWLAYQFLDFDNPIFTGTMSFRF